MLIVEALRLMAVFSVLVFMVLFWAVSAEGD
jgi:hypothetical protein